MRITLVLLALASSLFAGPEDARKRLKEGIKARDVAVLRKAVAADTDRAAFKGVLRPRDYAALSRFVKDSEAARKIVTRATAKRPVVKLPPNAKWTPQLIEQVAKKYRTPPVFALAAGLQSRDAKLRTACALRLAALRDDRARPALAAALQKERDPATRQAITRGLGGRVDKPGPLYLALAHRIYEGKYPATQGAVMFSWNRGLVASPVQPHHYEAMLAQEAAQAALKWDADADAVKALLARIGGAQDLASKAVAGGELTATSQAPSVALYGPAVLARALRDARKASEPEVAAWLCEATALVRKGRLDPVLPELARALGHNDPLMGTAAAGTLRTLARAGRLDKVRIDESTFKVLRRIAHEGGGATGEAAAAALTAADLTDVQRRSLERRETPMSGSSTEIRPREPTLVTVFYGTDRAVFRVGFRWYAQQFWLVLALLVLWPLLPRVLLWLLNDRLARVAIVAKWACLVGAVVMVVIGTYDCMRMHEKHDRLGFDYGPERGPFDRLDGPYCHLGTLTVGIPPDHAIGEIERPGLLSGELWEDPQKHVVVFSIQPKEKSRFFRELKKAGDKGAFVFVHGFNVTFENAALRTAQIAHDLDFEGAPVFFSWPSRGEILQYTRDESTVAWATQHLKLFLRDVRRALPDRTIHLVAHSMGNRALTEALRRLARDIEHEGLPKFQEVVLAAPDLDAATFRDDIAPAIKGTADRVTLYAAAYDQALEVSKQVHGYPRAGDSSSLVVVDGVQSIDVAAEDSSILGHSYYGNVGSVIDDLVKLMLYRQGPAVRGLDFVEDGGQGFWRLK